MKNPFGKLIAVTLMLGYAVNSYSQYTPATIYQQHPSSNYYPHDHDSATTVMPKLIKSNFLYYGFLSSLNQHISFEFAHQMSDDVMLAAEVGIINLGFSQQSTNTAKEPGDSVVNGTSGGYFEGSVKLFMNPDYTRVGRHGYYSVEGLYIKPEFAVSIFTTTVTAISYSPYVYPPPTSDHTYSYTGGAIILNFGGQWIIAHCIAIDAYCGVGINFSNAYSANNPFTDNYFSYLTTSGNVPLAFTGGINIGLPFN